MFNTGQVTLPKKWRDKFDTSKFVAEETETGLEIRPISEEGDGVVFYQDEGGCGLLFEPGINPKVLIDKINRLNELDR